jgi:TIR domain
MSPLTGFKGVDVGSHPRAHALGYESAALRALPSQKLMQGRSLPTANGLPWRALEFSQNEQPNPPSHEVPRMPSVFLSYSHKDEVWKDRLKTHLGVLELDTWDDRRIEGGADWSEEIQKAMARASVAVLLISQHFLTSKFILGEEVPRLLQRRKEEGLPVIPVIVQTCAWDQVEWLRGIQGRPQDGKALSSFRGDRRNQELTKIAKEIGGILDRVESRAVSYDAPALIEPVLERLQTRFLESLRHNLAGGHLIRRKETQEVLAQLEAEATRIVVVHGVAGVGKSGVLFELAEQLADQGFTLLPLRLDRHELQGDPQRFGQEKLGLPGSPAKSLAAVAGEKGGVLLLDQLDALRWTSAHSSESWDVCREVVSEALVSTAALKVVACCRTFDLEHDPQLRGWEQETKNLRRVEVQQLSSEDVTAAIERAAEGRENAPILRPKEQELLRHIHHLQMWLTIYKSTKSAPSFDTSWSLMVQFWANRLDELEKAGITKEQAEKFEQRFVEAMKQGAVLTAPVRKLGMSQRDLELYQHHHLIQVAASGNTFTFCHQSYQDYLIAKHLLGELDKCISEEGGRKIVAWLGNREKQSLFRREQLRLLLGALRAEEHEAYLPALREFLPLEQSSAERPIRFHLRQLVLQLLGQVTDPRPEEVHHVLALLDQPFWREHVLAEVMRGQVPWFEVLDDHGRLEAWLASDDPQLQSRALDMMLYVVERSGDRVARLLSPYRNRDEAWTRRILWVLRFDPAQDSDMLFELRLQLAKEGSYTADHVDWGMLAQTHPTRFVLLTAYVVMAFAVSMSRGENRRRPGRRTEIDWHTLERVSPTVIPREYWSTLWRNLSQSLSLVAQLKAYDGESQYVLESYAVDFETLQPVLRLLKDFGRALLEDNWLEFVRFGEEFSTVHRRAEVLFLHSLVEGPFLPEFADWALGWLMADPWRPRLRLRRNQEVRTLPGQLIERFAPVCSPEAYKRLEQWLLAYREPDLLENYKHRHKGRSSSFGKTPFALLPKLPVGRRSAKVDARLEELSRKFPPQTPSGEEDEGHVSTGPVESPLLEDVKMKMSDADWLAIATNEKLASRGGRISFKKGRVEEASVETFTADFQSMTQRQPARFAMLAGRLPPTANQAFLKAILSGLAWPGDRNGQPQTVDWVPPSHTVLEEVLALPAVRILARSEDDAVAEYLCQILGRYSEYPWSKSSIELLVWIAQSHKDPKHDFYPVGSPDQDSEHFDSLEANALNVTRGAAGFAIRNLLFKQPALFQSLRPAVESLIHDEHPAVRVAALAACLPVINIDRDLAVGWFLQGCEDPDAILATHEARDFLRCTYRTHIDQLQPLIKRMIASPSPKVATAGAIQVAACFLVAGQLAEEFEHCLCGTPSQRKGVAEVAASLLGETEFAEKAKATLLRLAEDEEKQVAKTVARSFEHLDLRHITSDRKAWNKFARSKAFQVDPSPLLRALDHQTGDLLPYADCLLSVGATFASELAEASQDMATGISGDARQLLPLLLRLYEQAKDKDQALYLRCLDLWDRLLERRVGAAMGLTRELDRM